MTVQTTPGAKRRSPSPANIMIGSTLNDAEIIRIQETGPGVGAYCIDLRRCVSFELPALLALVVIATSRKDQGQVTLFQLPVDYSARQYLRSRKFPEVIQAATGIPFRFLVQPEDLPYFGENRHEGDHPEQPMSPMQFMLHSLVSSSFFGFTSYRLDREQTPIFNVEAEWNRWKDPTVLDLMRGLLSGESRDLSRVVLYELLTNAVYHPDARIAIVAADISMADDQSNGELLISVWDDGKSILDTLKEALRADKSIRLGKQNAPDRFVLHSGQNRTSKTFRADWTPTLDSPDEHLLLASLFLGISRKASSISSADPTQRREFERTVGFGLHALYRTVAHDFNGRLEISCNSSRLRLSASPDSDDIYDVTTDRPRWSPLGNLVSLRIPLTVQ